MALPKIIRADAAGGERAIGYAKRRHWPKRSMISESQSRTLPFTQRVRLPYLSACQRAKKSNRGVAESHLCPVHTCARARKMMRLCDSATLCIVKFYRIRESGKPRNGNRESKRMSAALRGMVSGRDPHNATTRRAIIKAYGLKISGPFRTKIIRGKSWRDLSPAETSLLLACDACDAL
jgi:hypothetical protein